MHFDQGGHGDPGSQAPDLNPGLAAGTSRARSAPARPAGRGGAGTVRGRREGVGVAAAAPGPGGRCPPGRAGEQRGRRRGRGLPGENARHRECGWVGAGWGGWGGGCPQRRARSGISRPPSLPPLRLSRWPRAKRGETGARSPAPQQPALRPPFPCLPPFAGGGGRGTPRPGAGWKFTGSVRSAAAGEGEPASQPASQRARGHGGRRREGGRGAAEHRLAGKARDQMTVRKGGSRHRRERSQPRRSGTSPGRRPDVGGARLPPGRLGGDGGGPREAGGLPGLGRGRRRG